MKIAEENVRRKDERQGEKTIIVTSEPEKDLVSMSSGFLNFSLRC